MKGKLIKRTNERYDLYYSEDINQLNTIASTQHEPNIGKLSIQNCQAIENGYYDLDELAKDYAINQLANPNEYEHSIYAATIQNTYMVGFKKALELLGDKKYSEEDIIIAMTCMQGQEVFYEKTYEETQKSRESYIKNYIQSLQQAEWDVWITMACGLSNGCTEPNVECSCEIVPAVDEEGFLIFNKI